MIEIDTSTFEVLNESNATVLNAVDSLPRVEGLPDGDATQVAAHLRNQRNVVDLVALPNGRWVTGTNRSTEGSLQSFDKMGNSEKTLPGKGCGFVSIQLTRDGTYGVSVCERTGTTEWTFGKTLERSAVVFDTQTMTSLKSIPLSKQCLQTSIEKDDWRIWYPQPSIWNSGQLILIAVPDFSGSINLQELHP